MLHKTNHYNLNLASLILSFLLLGCKTYEIYYCDIKAPGFKDYHRRLQPWIMFFIDAASYIDDDDDNWRFFLL